MSEDYYKKLYEEQLNKNRELTEQLVAAEERLADVERKLGALKNSLLYKAIMPFRLLWSHTKNGIIRVKRYGSIKNLIKKIKSKMIERSAYKDHGSLSFPDEVEAERQRETKFSQNHKFSILVPLFNTPEKFLLEMVDSVMDQTYENWELCLVDGSDNEHSYVERIVKSYKDDRIKYKKLDKNYGISGNTNKCLELATGDYIALFDHDDVLHPSVLYEYACVLEITDADYIYCDEATFKGNSIDNMVTLHFKPDFSPDNLRANNYICHFSAFKKSLIDKVGAFRTEYDGSQDHDLILRLTTASENIVHVPKILYYWRSHAASVAQDINAKSYAIDAAKRAVLSDLESQGIHGAKIESTRAFPTIFRIRYPLEGNPKVSIIIPNKDHREDLERCIVSIQTRLSYENYEIIVVENNSTTDEIKEYYKSISECENIKLARYKGEFNFSKIVNAGVSIAEGEYVLLLNNDTQIITRNLIEEMLMFAMRNDVGAVGAKLYYEDYTIQHAGVVIGLGAHRSAGHTHYGLSKDNLGYMGRLCYAQDVTAVTGACLMVSKANYNKVGGFDESFTVALNDVDFCLKLRHAGLLNIFTPFAEAFHFESKSRGDDRDVDSERAKRYEKECKRFKEKWADDIAAGDPYYNINFSLDHSNYTLRSGGFTSVSD